MENSKEQTIKEKKGLNISKGDKDYMDRNDKKILTGLQFISSYLRKEIELWDINKVYNYKIRELPDEVKDILLKNGYMSYDEKDLPDKDHLITKKGNQHKHELVMLRFKDAELVVIIIAIASFILNVIVIGINLGWWNKLFG